MLRSASEGESVGYNNDPTGPGRTSRRSSSQYPGDNAIYMKRAPYTQVAFDDVHLKDKGEIERTSLQDKVKKQIFCSKKRLWKLFTTFFPIIKVLRYYNIKENIVIDILSGVTVGILHIPQALAFGYLTSVKLENGLYTSIWPIIIYVIFGTSQHVSMGTSAVICIVTASVIDRQADEFKLANPNLLQEFAKSDGNSTVLPVWEDIPAFMDYKENVAMSITLFVGAVLLIMGFLRLGFVTAYLSESFFNAFTSGAAVHIATSQIPAIIGISIPRYGGAFKIIKTYSALFGNIASIEWETCLTALVSIAILVFVKEFINEKFKDKLFIPIPVELIVVILATIISYFANLKECRVDVVGTIPSDLPVPVVPDITGFENYFVDCFVIAILIFANTIAMAKVCAKKHNYEVDDSQELIAYGMCNFISSFLKCFPSAVAPPRSMVASNMNTKSTLSGVFVTVLMILVVMAMSPLFEPLPKAALASIIIVALKGLFVQMGDCVKFWRINKHDFVIWFFTIMSVVFLDIDLGLGIGVGISLITVVTQTQFSRGYRLGRTMKDSVIVEHKVYRDSVEQPGVKIFRFQSNLYFANAEIFRSSLYRSTVNPRKLLKLLKKQEKKLAKAGKSGIDEMENGQIKRNNSDSNLILNGKSPKSSTTSLSSEFSAGLYDNQVFTVSDEKGTAGSQNNGLSIEAKYRQPKVSIASNISSMTDEEEEEEDPEDGQEPVSEKKLKRLRRTHHVIVDCSNMNYLDASGANVLGHISTEYAHVNITFFIAGCSKEVRRTMEHASTYDKIPKAHVFLEVHDAIAVARMGTVQPLPAVLEDFSDDEAGEDSYITKM